MTFRRARASVLLLWLVACGGGGPADPCAAVAVCSSPPAAHCASATVAVTYPATGTCTSPQGTAECAYPPTEVDCALAGKACGDGGACVDPCLTTACTTPPAAYCASATVAITYPAAGTCTSPAGAAVCAYPPTTVDCALEGRACGGGGTCVDPCAAAGVCAAPPAAHCASATVAITYPAAGTCTSPAGAAVCAYPPTTVDCALAGQVCGAGAACVDPVDPCASAPPCSTPPAAYCASATVAVTYPATGTCSASSGAAVCTYPPTEVDCALAGGACGAGGTCIDPCAATSCTTPPAAYCASSTVAITFPGAGTCTSPAGAAVCAYPPAEVDCALAGKACGAGGVCIDPANPCQIPSDGGDFLAYTDDRTGDFEIRAMRQDGTCDQLVGAGPGYDLQPWWSASAGLLAWTGERGGNKRVVLQPAAGGDQRVLDTGPELATGAVLSPDGSRVAFERLPLGGFTADIYAVPAAGGTPTALVAAAGTNDAGPVLSSSTQGDFLYFISGRSGTTEVWRVALSATGAATGTPEQLTTGSRIIGRPTVSGDGRLLAWSYSDGISFPKIVVRDLVVGTERTLSDQADTEPAFPATGSVIAVRTGRFDLSTGDLVLLDVATGTLVRRLTNGSSRVGSPAFPR